MSEYQYYEFRSVDGPLTEDEQQEIGSWSSRSYPTAIGATFVYNYGSFRKNEKRAVERYFDAMFYISNWGTKQLIFKFPMDLVDIEAIRPYCTHDEISLSESGKNVLVDFCFSEEEGGGWVDGEGWLDSLIDPRNNILHGDYRALYLAWLHAGSLQSEWEDFDNDEPEPPVPDHLDSLNGSLKSLVELLEMDQDVLGAAIKGSRGKGEKPDVDMKGLIQHLPDTEKDDFLLRLAQGESLLSVRFLKRLKELSTAARQIPESISNRTIGSILREADQLRQERKEAGEKEKEAKRLKKLAELEAKESALWEEVHGHISEKKPKAYDDAINILQDLHKLALHKGERKEFERRIQQLLQEYSWLSFLKSKIRMATLT